METRTIYLVLNRTAKTLTGFMIMYITLGSIVWADEWSRYKLLARNRFIRQILCSPHELDRNVGTMERLNWNGGTVSLYSAAADLYDGTRNRKKGEGWE